MVRRIVRDYIAAAIDRAKPSRERYIAEHLQYPESFPLTLAEPVASASLRESLQDKIRREAYDDYFGQFGWVPTANFDRFTSWLDVQRDRKAQPAAPVRTLRENV